MKKLLILIMALCMGSCVNERTDYLKNIDTKFLKGKVIYQVLPTIGGDEVSIIFTDSTAVTIGTGGSCWLIMRK